MKQKVTAILTSKSATESVFKWLVSTGFDVEISETNSMASIKAEKEIEEEPPEIYMCQKCRCVTSIDYDFCPTCGEPAHKGNIQ